MAQNRSGQYPSDINQSNYYPADQTQYRRISYQEQVIESEKKARAAKLKRAKERRRQELRRRRQRHQRTLMGILLLICVAVAFVVIKNLNGTWGAATDNGLDDLDLDDTTITDEAEELLYTGEPIATIAFVGEISTSSDQILAVTQSDGTYDFSTVFTDVADYFSSANVAYAVASLESTIVDGVSYGTDPYYNSPIELAGAMKTLGIRLVSTATTCALNNGIEGLISTKNYLTQAKLRVVGTYLSEEERNENGGAYIRNIHKITFAFLSYTKGTDSVTMPDGCDYALNTLYSDYSDYWSNLNSTQIKKDVQAAKDAGAEVIVALVHWGSEYGRSVSDNMKEAAELLLENGVDVIIGTHTHLVNAMGFEDVELSDGTKKTCFVAYGLGDFYTDPEKETAQQSMILNLEFTKDDDGTVSITGASYVPIYMHIYEIDGVKQFQILDVYKNLAELKRNEDDLTSEEAELFNSLLDTVDTMHNYGGEDLDAGPADTDKRIVEKAIDGGEISSTRIRALQEAEAAAEEEEE